MKAVDLQLITRTAAIYPDILPHLINIYRLGYKQSIIDLLKSSRDISNVYGINFGNEIKPSN